MAYRKRRNRRSFRKSIRRPFKRYSSNGGYRKGRKKRRYHPMRGGIRL